ncbi:MAG: prepilin-type N-terminal cleavage/methylation domain-containing protein [Patescibacteria group bacterium]
MKIFLKKVNSQNRGFTLLETLVAISIFVASVLALLSILSQGISGASYAKRKMIASYLAEEGVEYIKNLRDTYVLYSASGPVGWNTFNTKVAGGTFPSSSICATANGCYFDESNVSFSDSSMPMTDLLLPSCTSATCSNAPLLYDSTTGKYGYNGGVYSGYSRKINIVQISVNETKVFSTVYWNQGSGTYSIVFSDNLFNWVE